LASGIPANPTQTLTCIDGAVGLSGDVGIIETPGERPGTSGRLVAIRPGFTDGASFDATRDGQLQPVISSTSASSYYNLALLPAWQLRLPQYRIGTITSMTETLATVNLDPCLSSGQFSMKTNINLNESSTLTRVPFSYRGSANGDLQGFKAGSSVIIEFPGREWGVRQIIGAIPLIDPPCVQSVDWSIVGTDGSFPVDWGVSAEIITIFPESVSVVNTPTDISIVWGGVAIPGTGPVDYKLINLGGDNLGKGNTLVSGSFSGTTSGLGGFVLISLDEFDSTLYSKQFTGPSGSFSETIPSGWSSLLFRGKFALNSVGGITVNQIESDQPCP